MTPVEFITIRKGAKLSQPALAAMLGVSRATVARYEAKPPKNSPIPLLVERFMNELKGTHP